MKRLSSRFSQEDTIVWGEKAEEVSGKYAADLIYRRYLKLCKIARTIDATTPDKKIHSLRIQCKKLRYLLEFFVPLFPEASLKEKIGKVKLLQEHLGNFNDCVVQQKFFQDILQRVSQLFFGKEVEVAESIGALCAMLHQLQQEERRAALAAFERFDSEETRTGFASSFSVEVSL